MEFDWHISPSDRFNYESQFAKLISKTSTEEASLSDLESLYHASHLSQHEFLQIWALISLAQPSLNEEGYIYFRHVLESRRRGKLLPVGVPLDVKERILKAKSTNAVYIRTQISTRDPAGSSQKDIPQLQHDLAAVELEHAALISTAAATDDALTAACLARDEFTQLAEYGAKKLSAIRADVDTLRAAGAVGAGGVLNSNELSKVVTEAEEALKQGVAAVDALRKERAALLKLKLELHAECE